MSTFAQMADLCPSGHREKPLHIVAEARGPLLEGFIQKIRDMGIRHPEKQRFVTADVLPTEDMAAGFMAQCGMDPQLSPILKVPDTLPHAAMMSAAAAHCACNQRAGQPAWRSHT